jgi:antitoxin ParD1/3/4
MARTSRPITVTLGDLRERVEARVQSGAYGSVSEVLRAAVRALDREDAALDDWLRQRVVESLADPRPNLPAREVLQRLRAHHASRSEAEQAGASRSGAEQPQSQSQQDKRAPRGPDEEV